MTNEERVEKIVERYAGDISIFLGAGASMPIGLPDMVSFWENAYGNDFFETINSNCSYTLNSKDKLSGAQMDQNNKTVIRRLIQTASIGKNAISRDLEDLFDYIHQCPILSNSAINREALKKTFYFYQTCARNDTGNFDNYKRVYSGNGSQIETWINNVLDCIEELRRKLYDSYLIDDGNKWDQNIDNAASCYSILPKLFDNKCAVVFTTNYDTVFDALDIKEKLKLWKYKLQNGTLFDEVRRRFYFSLDNYLKEIEKTLVPLVLFRMHGSVAWEQKNKKIEDHFPNKSDNRAEIVEPVISKKLPEKEPFRGMYDIFQKILQKNKILLSIGFSFRDDAIRKIVEDVLVTNQSFKVICVAPTCEKVPELDDSMKRLEEGYTSRFIWLKNRFGEPETEKLILESVKEALRIV